MIKFPPTITKPGKIRNYVVVSLLLITFVFTPKSAQRIGDYFQIALPAAGFACSIANGSWGEYLVRFTVMEALLQGSKHGLGETEINLRPNGRYHGFPSGHTTAAVFGASSLIKDCISGSYLIKAGIAITAAFVGASRITSDNHNIWQVLAGAILGLLTQVAFANALRKLFNRRKNANKDTIQNNE